MAAAAAAADAEDRVFGAHDGAEYSLRLMAASMWCSESPPPAIENMATLVLYSSVAVTVMLLLRPLLPLPYSSKVEVLLAPLAAPPPPPLRMRYMAEASRFSSRSAASLSSLGEQPLSKAAAALCLRARLFVDEDCGNEAVDRDDFRRRDDEDRWIILHAVFAVNPHS